MNGLQICIPSRTINPQLTAEAWVSAYATNWGVVYAGRTSSRLRFPKPMFLSYRDANGEFVKAFQGFEEQAAKRLSILNAAPNAETLRALQSNRLEAMRGDQAGQYSIRVNQQWRVCFEWPYGQSGPTNVEIVDYH